MWTVAGIGAGLLGLWLAPAALARRGGHQFQVKAHGQIEVEASSDVCSNWLRDATHLSLYEDKVDRVSVEIIDSKTVYTCFGRFFGVPWTGTFSMDHTADGGFHSVMVSGAHEGNADGGFRLKALKSGRTRVTHYESYRINVWVPFAVLARPLIQRWLERTLANEMVVLDGEFAALASEAA